MSNLKNLSHYYYKPLDNKSLSYRIEFQSTIYGNSMNTITIEYVKERFDNQSALAEQLNISRQAVSRWFITGEIPKLRQYEIKEILDNSV
tara:strand:- start:500 stop:769 length:270 start_codon:yes stop_codon:yes gene_type:complete